MANLKQILSSAWHQSFCDKTRFDEIIGHESVKVIFNKALLSKRPVHILLIGKPGTAKTMSFITHLCLVLNLYEHLELSRVPHILQNTASCGSEL
ncbi:hypothetical protein BH18THE1_BH18THE1_21050 [soil metagenome]